MRVTEIFCFFDNEWQISTKYLQQIWYIYEKIGVLRVLKGVSQEKMAEDLNISRSKVSSWETGRREMSLYDAIVISDYFEVSMDNLFNKKALNSEQVVQIVKRYFNNDKISLDEKKET